MLTLIKREIEDHILYFLIAVIFIPVLIAIGVSFTYREESRELWVMVWSLIFCTAFFCTLGFCGMGVTQMYTDRTRKISALLSTLPVSRGRILGARIITGILLILTVLVPFAITAKILLYILVPPVLIYSGFVFEIFSTVFLLSFACYCIGLQTGWSSSRITPSLGGLGLACVLVPLIVVKGFGLHSAVILLLFIAGSLICTWYKFKSASL